MKKGLCFMLCIAVMLSSSGCWSRREPKTLAIVESAIYDYKSDVGYQITTEILNPAALGGIQGSGGGKSPNITTISEGASAPEAIRNASTSMERSLFGGHNKVRFFSERLAQKDIAPVLDYLLRDYLTDENPFMVVIKGEDPQQIYSCMLGLSDTVGGYIHELSKEQPGELSNSVFVSTLDFVKDYYDDGIQPVMGVVEMVECESKSANTADSGSGSSGGTTSDSETKYKIKYEGLAAFKGGTLVGYMDGVEARSYNFITNNMDSAPISIKTEDDFTVFLISGSKAAIEATADGDDITINVKIKVVLALIQEGAAIDISKAESLKEVEDGFNKQLWAEIAAAIQKAQTEFQSDIFGFGKAVHAQHPEKWKEIKDNWDDYFAKATVIVSVESSVDRSGQMKEPFNMED